MHHVHHINLQAAVGGGEVYTRFFSRALVDAGAKVTLYVLRSNRFWDGLRSVDLDVVPVDGIDELARRLPSSGAFVVTQSRMTDEFIEHAARNHILTGFAHMPMLDRSAAEFQRYATVFTVSNYCIGLLRRAGVMQVYPEPLYGTFSFDRISTPATAGGIRARSPYHWDRRKGRDRVLSLLEPLIQKFRTPPTFVPKPGMTLGIVSLLSPIKQFPVLFTLLAPHIAKVPDVNLEIFGDGGYAQVRDLRRALAPLKSRVRFWGYQREVQRIYPALDYLMTGLPEKEALGLNVLESQALGTPVLAPNAPPFTETVLHEQTGFLYGDPRTDGGKSFSDLLTRLKSGQKALDPRLTPQHLARFSYAALVDRTRGVLGFVQRKFTQVQGA